MKPKPVVKKGRAIKDCATENWSDEFDILPEDGIPSRVLVPREEADSANTLGRHLSKKGARLPRAPGDRKLLLETIIASKPTRIMHRLADTGWQIGKGDEERPWFNAGKRLIGVPTSEIGYLSPSMIAKSRAKFFSSIGTLEEWQSRIAVIAAMSTCMTIAMAAAFAAPLLRLAGLPNFSLLLGGPSRSGKSSTLLIATSVCGIGHEKYLLNWSGTGLGILEAAAGFGDIIFPVNEVGAKKGKRSEVYEGLRDLFAQYAEGSDRERHSSHQPVEARRFHGICIATAERSIADYAKLAGEDRDDGELFRAIDVIAVRDGKKTVLDLAPDTLDQQVCLKTLRKDLEMQHGTALAPYIKFLAAMGEAAAKLRIDALVLEFVSHMPAAAYDNVADQMATNFGLLYAGAILGIESGVLPWSKHHVGVALRRGFNDALEYSKPIDHLGLAQEILKKNLREKLEERKPDSKFGRKDHAGFWKIESGKRIIVVNCSRFRAWFGNDAQIRGILEWLSTEGYLMQEENSTRGLLTQKDLDGSTLNWPDGKPVRSFSFSDPFAEPAEKAAQQAPVDLKGSGVGKVVKPRLGGPMRRDGAAKRPAKPKLTNPGADAAKAVKPRLGGPPARAGAAKQAAKPKLTNLGAGAAKAVKPRLGGPPARARAATQAAKPKPSKAAQGVGRRPSQAGSKRPVRLKLLSILDHPLLRDENNDD